MGPLLMALLGCPPPDGGDGTITVRLTGAEAHNGVPFGFGIVPAGTSYPAGALGSGEAPIVNGSAEAVARTPGTGAEIIIFTGGVVVDIGGWIDLDGDDIPSAGDYYGTKAGVEVDGDTLVEFTFPTDFVVLPESPSDWQLYGTWTNDDYNGLLPEGPPAKFIFHESGEVEVYKNVPDSIPIGTVQIDITDDWIDEEAHWFHTTQDTGGGIVYSLFRISSGGNTLESVNSDAGYPDPDELDPLSYHYTIFFRQE